MQNRRLGGVIVPCLTPFTPEGDVDTELLKGVVEFLKNKVQWISIGGIYGSGIMMELEERKRALKTAVEAAAGEAGILAFVGATNTDTSMSLARYAESVGADAVSCVEPIYYKQVDEAVFRHYRDLVQATALPVYIYDSPVFSGNSVSVEVLNRLADSGLAGTITGHAGLGIEHLWSVMRKVGTHRLDIISIRDGLALPAMMAGAKGFETGVGNYLPELVVELYEAITSEAYERALELQDRILHIRDVSHWLGKNIPSLHALMSLRGVKTGVPKKPFFPLSMEETEQLRRGVETIEGVAELLV